MTVTESQKCDNSHRMVTSHTESQSQSQHMTEKSADRYEDYGKQGA